MRNLADLQKAARALPPDALTLTGMLMLAFIGLWQIGTGTAATIETTDDIRNGALVTVEIARNEFHIPRGYFLPRDVSTNPERIAIWIHALWPDMAPMRDDNKERYANVRGHGPLLNILATDQQHITTLDFRLGAATKLAAPYVKEPIRFGLEVIMPKDVNPNDVELRQEVYVDKG